MPAEWVPDGKFWRQAGVEHVATGKRLALVALSLPPAVLAALSV
jgi:hypothetical protein